MTVKTNERIAGFTFLFGIAAGIAGMAVAASRPQARDALANGLRTAEYLREAAGK
jgi:hypothetical protein